MRLTDKIKTELVIAAGEQTVLITARNGRQVFQEPGREKSVRRAMSEVVPRRKMILVAENRVNRRMAGPVVVRA